MAKGKKNPQQNKQRSAKHGIGDCPLQNIAKGEIWE
jgi:hypothetical protein